MAENWVKRIGGVKRIDKRRMEELREEGCVKKCLGGSWLMWAGHVERMEVERLTKRADALRVEGRRGGRLRVRWEDCVKRDLAVVG